MQVMDNATLQPLRESVACNLCGSNSTQQVYTIDSRDLLLSTLWIDGTEYATQSQESIVRCSACGLVYVNPRLKMSASLERYSDEAEANYFSQTYSERSLAYERFVASLPQWCGQMPQTLLDVGCGDGVLIEVGRAAGIQCAGTEQREVLCEQVRSKYGADSIVSADLSQIAPESYSVVTLLNVIEHLYDPKEILTAIHHIIEPNGLLFIHAPNFGGIPARIQGKTWNQIDPFEHFYYFTYQTLCEMLTQCGYEPIGRFSLLTATGTKETVQRMLNRAHIFVDNGLGVVCRRVGHHA